MTVVPGMHGLRTLFREENVMRKAGVWTCGLVAMAAIFLISTGCTKKQTVKSTDTATAGSTPSVSSSTSSTPEGPSMTASKAEPIASETPKYGEAAPAAPTDKGGVSGGTQMAAATAEAGVAATEEKASPFQDIHFDFNKAFIREDAKPHLTKVAEYMKKTKGATLLIEGHCDERGTPEYNMALGEKRAESARAYLKSLGVPPAAVSTVSFGELKPAVPGHDEGSWSKNRRDHFVVK